MVAMKHHLACCSLKLAGRVTISRETHENGQPAKLLQGNETSGLDLEKEISDPVEGELFFLTSLFIELIGRA
jgi:hypothetical protein